MRSSTSISFLARKAKPTLVSPFFCAVALLVILIVSLFPFTGWRFTGEPIFAFYSYPLPYYFTVFDNAINVLAYIPLGFGLVLIWRRFRLRLIYALLGGVAVSAGIEFTQQFLPGRIASNLDILSNGFGSLCGALLGLIFSTRVWQTKWQIVRYDFFAPGAVVEWGLVWLGLWFATQFDPSLPFLGVVVMPLGLPQPFISPIDNPVLFLRLLEGGGMMLHLLGVALFVSVLMRYSRQIPVAIIGFLSAALLIKIGFAGMLLELSQFFAWLNVNIVIGGVLGAAILWVLWQLNRRLRALAGLLALIAAQSVANLWPLTPQFTATMPLFRWSYGHLQHFNGLSRMIGELWPYGAMLFLLYFLVFPPQEHNW